MDVLSHLAGGDANWCWEVLRQYASRSVVCVMRTIKADMFRKTWKLTRSKEFIIVPNVTKSSLEHAIRSVDSRQ